MPLGYVWQSQLLVMAALVAYVIITIGVLATLRRNPLPLRPSMMIFLAPVCMFALGFGLLGHDMAFTVFYWVGSVMALGLLALVPWMIKGG